MTATTKTRPTTGYVIALTGHEYQTAEAAISAASGLVDHYGPVTVEERQLLRAPDSGNYTWKTTRRALVSADGVKWEERL